MNNKMPANLDPKLKETYERVMGTSFSPTTTPSTAEQPRPVQATVVQEPEAPIAPQPITPTPLPPIDVANPVPVSGMVQSPQMPQTNNTFQPTVTSTPSAILQAKPTKKHNFLMPVLLSVVGLIFFIAYAVIWAKVFGMF